MASLEELIEPLRHSPRLPEVVSMLQLQIEAEREQRAIFYEEMTPEQKVEFIDGEVVLHSPPARNRHLEVTMLICQLLSTFVRVRKLGTVKVEKCLCVFPRNDYEPDIVFFGREKTAQLTPDTVRFPVPDMAVEVLSQSTESRDRGVKFEDFAANGVQEYWSVDADAPVLEQYVLRDGDYELKLKSSTGKLECEGIEGLVTDVHALFDESANFEAMKSLME